MNKQDREKEILEYLGRTNEYENRTIKKIAEFLSVSYPTVYHDMNLLEAKGKIIRKKVNRSSVFEVK